MQADHMYATGAELPKMLCGCAGKCSAKISFEAGDLRMVDGPPMFQIEPASVNLIGRRDELDKVHRLINVNRLTHVYGPKGIGKSCLIEALCTEF